MLSSYEVDSGVIMCCVDRGCGSHGSESSDPLRQLHYSLCAVLTEGADRTDLSHPIHSDNCIIQPDNTCKRVPPAYTSRDYR